MERKRAFGYVRVSEMRDEKWSPAAQKQAISEEADKLQIPLLQVFQDLDVNSASIKRKGTWDTLVDTVGEGDVVITGDFTRIGRNQLDTLQRVASLVERGCGVISLEQRFDLEGVYGKAILGLMAGIAEADNTLRGIKIKQAAREKIKAGQWTGGPLPFGYRYGEREGKCLAVEVDQDRAEIVREMYRLRLSGNGWESIMRTLSNGRRWSSAGIRGILRNPAYIGERVFEGTTYPLNLTPLIDRETWDKVQAIDLREPSRGRKTYLLSRMLTCSLCDGPMVHSPQRGKAKASYLCASRKVWGDCKGVGICEHIVDRVVLEQFFERVESEGYREAVEGEKKKPRASGSSRLESEIARVQGRQDRLLSLYLDSGIDRGALDRQSLELSARAEGLRRELATREAARILPPRWDGDIREDWQVLNLDEQRHALGLYIEKIVIQPGRGDRVESQWRSA